MNIPDDLMYTREHEWIRLEGDIAYIGITEHAIQQLGDIVYVELPAENETMTLEETFASLESVKAVSDCYAPLTGLIAEVNSSLEDTPETINDDCYGDGWIVKVQFDDKNELENLMTPEQYQVYINEETQ